MLVVVAKVVVALVAIVVSVVIVRFVATAQAVARVAPKDILSDLIGLA